MRNVLAWLIFPVTVTVVLGAGLWALGNDVSSGWVVGLGTFGSLAIVAVLERVQPYRPDWNHSQGDLTADALYLPTYLGVNALFEPFVRVAAVALGVAVSESIGIGLWPGDWSLLAQLVLASVVVEAFDYWPHRLLHEVPALWRFHAIHHNPKRLYWLNATRAHPVEIAFRGIVNVIPLALLGAGEALLAMVALTNTVLGLFQHANIDFKLGPLSWIFSVGEMHRWHHSVTLAEANHNYGSNFLFWDIVFGTRYRHPERSGPDEIGIESDDIPVSYWGQLGAPFRS
ncbi:MAG: sterol desaturase family protein [Myxococcota bacterium]